MKATYLAFAASLLAGTALAQTTPPGQPQTTPPGQPLTRPPATGMATPARPDGTAATVAPGNVVDTGKSAASGDDNQAVATTSQNAANPARGSNSFTEGQAESRIAEQGFSNVASLKKDQDGVWRGTAMKNGKQTPVWLDYKGNVGEGTAPAVDTDSFNLRNPMFGRTDVAANEPGAQNGRFRVAQATTSSGTNPEVTPVTPSGQGPAAVGAALTTATGAGPTATNSKSVETPDGTPGNPPGTAAGRAIDKTVGSNMTGANPTGQSATSKN